MFKMMINVFSSILPTSHRKASQPFGTGAGTEHTKPRVLPEELTAEKPPKATMQPRPETEPRATGTGVGPEPPRKRPHRPGRAPPGRAGPSGSSPPPDRPGERSGPAAWSPRQAAASGRGSSPRGSSPLTASGPTHSVCPQTLTISFKEGLRYLVVLHRGQP